MDSPDVLGLRQSRSYRPLPVQLRVEGEWESAAILREIAAPVGVVLFGTIRDVMLWLSTIDSAQVFEPSAAERRRADLAAVAPPAELATHLSMLVRVCDAAVGHREVGSACIAVAGWAKEHVHVHTELAYTQAGALAQPDILDYSLETARLARDLAQYRRSETWFRRTIKRARLVRDRSTYVLAYLGLGNLYGRTGNGPAAKSLMELALRSAQRWRLPELAGRAHHDLIRVWAELGDLRRAYEHAREAERLYQSAPDLTVRLAADVGTLWLRAGASERALAIFEAILPKAPDSGTRAMWAAQVARSAANAGRVEAYDKARDRAVRAIANSRDRWRNADAEWILALADLHLGRWDSAASAAESALCTATAISAAETQIGAERTLEDARAHRREGAAVDLDEPLGLSRVAERLAGVLREAVAA